MVAAGGHGGLAASAGLNASALPPALFCHAHYVSYTHRVDHTDVYNWCIVPGTAYDVTLFGGLAVVLACLLVSKLNTLLVLIAGGLLMGLAWPFNLGALGNSIAIWLGINPWQLFFYVFLPPLLLDAAVRIDWYLFKKSYVQVLTLAFLVVGATCVAMVPIMLYMLGLHQYGWNWLHACMFGAMIASTDAVAIVAVMKTSGGPRRLRVLLEGESLLNDASGLTLFEVFFHLLQVQITHPEDLGSMHTIVGQVFLAVLQLGLIGFVLGMAFGVLTRLLLRLMRHLGAGHDSEVALTLGMAYLAYWITGIPCKGSGVVAVAVMGLYGASTNVWDMSTAAHHTFDGFWETLAFIVNALVFFYSGVSTLNFFIRASVDLERLGPHHDLHTTLYMLPVLYVILMLLRFILTVVFRPVYMSAGGDMSMRECAFVCVAGLRGAASLIMGSAVVTWQTEGSRGTAAETFSIVKSMMVFWTAGFVLLTLIINAPLLPWVLRITGLSMVPEKQLQRRARAVAALGEHTVEVMEQLRDAEDELLAGVDWAQVAAFVDHGRKYSDFVSQQAMQPGAFAPLATLRHWLRCLCLCTAWRRRKQALCHSNSWYTGDGKPRDGYGQRSHHTSKSSHHPGSGSGGAAGGSSSHIKHIIAANNGDGGASNGAFWPGSTAPHSDNADVEHGGPTLNGTAAALAPAADRHALGARGVSLSSAERARTRAARARERRRAGRDGDASDSEGSSRSSSSVGSSNRGSGSDSSSDKMSRNASFGGLLDSVLPELGSVGAVDIDGLECPFMSFKMPKENQHSGGSAVATSTGASASRQRGRFWVSGKTGRHALPVKANDAAPEGTTAAAAAAAAASARGATTAADRNTLASAHPHHPHHHHHHHHAAAPEAAEDGRSCASPPPARGGGSTPTSAGRAARLSGMADGSDSLTASADKPASASASSQSKLPISRSLSTATGSVSLSAAQLPPVARERASKSYTAGSATSAGSGLLQQGPTHQPSWGLSALVPQAFDGLRGAAAQTMGFGRLRGHGGGDGCAADHAGARSSGLGHAAAEKALGRTSGIYRSSVAGGGGAGGDLAARSLGLATVYTAAGAGRHSGGDAAPTTGPAAAAGEAGSRLHAAAAAGAGPRPNMRSLGTRSVGLAGTYFGSSADAPESSNRSLATWRHTGSAGDLAGTAAVAAGVGSSTSSIVSVLGGSMRGIRDQPSLSAASASRLGGSERGPRRDRASTGSDAVHGISQGGAPASTVRGLARDSTGLRGLATRSMNPHGTTAMPALAPSLATISSFGRHATTAATANGAPGGGMRRLDTRSVPVAEALAAAAAANAARGAVGPSLPTIAAGVPTPEAGYAAGSGGGGSGGGGATAVTSLPGDGGNGRVMGGILGRFRRSLHALPLIGTEPKGTLSTASSGDLGSSTPVGRLGASLRRGSRVLLRWDTTGVGGSGRGSSGGGGGLPSASAEELADARAWLLSGLKRHFYSKRMEGLLSARGLRILDAACDMALENSGRPMQLWAAISRDAANNMMIRLLTLSLFWLRRASLSLGSLGMPGRPLAYLLRLTARLLQRPLNKVLLECVEVAMEYLMGLTTSPYVAWLQESGTWHVLLAEVGVEAGTVAQFLIDREIEAPERYSAVQSYRVAMAVLRQQAAFVHSLFESGMLDSQEAAALTAPVATAERRLELLGPVWRAPSLRQVLRGLPFMREQPDHVQQAFARHGQLTQLGAGAIVPEDDALYVVISGMVKVTYQPDLGSTQEYYLGSGGVWNLYSSLTGELLPGKIAAAAQGNSLGKGPVLMRLPQRGLASLIQLASSQAEYEQLELDMHRLAALYILERLSPQLELEAGQAFVRVAPAVPQAAADQWTEEEDWNVPHATTGAGHGARTGARQSTRAARAAWVRTRLTMLRASVRLALPHGELLVLPRNCSVEQLGHAVLLSGSVTARAVPAATGSSRNPGGSSAPDAPVASGAASTLDGEAPGASAAASDDAAVADALRWLSGAGRHQRQSLLPWLWDVLSADDLRAAPVALPEKQPHVMLTAGPDGAKLLMCGPSCDDDVSFTKQSSLLLNTLLRPGGDAHPFTRPSNPLARGSGGNSATSAAGGAGVGTGAGVAPPAAANSFLRRTLAAAAAVDSVMGQVPCAAGGGGGSSGTTRPPGGSLLPAAGPPAEAVQPGTRAAAAPRAMAGPPLAGADLDNAVAVGVTQDGAGWAGRGNTTAGEGASSGTGHQHGTRTEEGVQARRMRSSRPLRPGGGPHSSGARRAQT